MAYLHIRAVQSLQREHVQRSEGAYRDMSFPNAHGSVVYIVGGKACCACSFSVKYFKIPSSCRDPRELDVIVAGERRYQLERSNFPNSMTTSICALLTWIEEVHRPADLGQC